jgi:hypothetical protein
MYILMCKIHRDLRVDMYILLCNSSQMVGGIVYIVTYNSTQRVDGSNLHCNVDQYTDCGRFLCKM